MRITLSLCLLLALSLSAQAAPELKAFSTDGCSLFPDGTFKNKDAWCDCCIKHDIAYWQGGTKAQKQQSDLALKRCIIEKTGNTLLAEAMYQGVKLGGHPIFPNWYRWGYGWPYGRQFQALNETELLLVDSALRYRAQQPQSNRCPTWNKLTNE